MKKATTVTEKFSFIKEIPQELLVSINTIHIQIKQQLKDTTYNTGKG